MKADRLRLSKTMEVARHFGDDEIEITIEVEAHGGDFVEATERLSREQQVRLCAYLQRALQ